MVSNSSRKQGRHILPDEENADSGIVLSPHHTEILVQAINLAVDNGIPIKEIENLKSNNVSQCFRRTNLAMCLQYMSHRIGSM
jgi:hypothetical protein